MLPDSQGSQTCILNPQERSKFKPQQPYVTIHTFEHSQTFRTRHLTKLQQQYLHPLPTHKQQATNMDDSDNEINYEHNARTSLSSLLTNYSDIDAINLDASGKVTKIEGGFDFPRTKALLLGLRSVNELSPRALALIHHHLKLNPCDYSVWKFRFECLAVQGKFPGVDPAPQLANAA